MHDNIRKGCGGPVWVLHHCFLVLADGSGLVLEEATDVPVWCMGSGVEGQGRLGGRSLNVPVVM